MAQPGAMAAVPDDPAVLLQQTREALRVLYGGHYNREEFKAAEHWLESLQRYPQAWGVAGALLADETATAEVLFFAAKILQDKIYYDFAELAPLQVEELKQQVVAHLAAWSTRQRQRVASGGGGGAEGMGAFLNRLCVVLAALGVQTNWQGVLTEAMNLMSAHGVPLEHLLHLLEELPTECHSEQAVVEEATREAFRRQLMALRPHVLAYLTQAAASVGADAQGEQGGGASSSSGSPAMDLLRRKIFRGMGRWVYYFRELPPSDIVAAPQVLDTAFEAIAQGAGGAGQQRGVFEAAVDLVIDVFQAYDLRNGGGGDLMALVQLMVPRALSLRGPYEAAVGKGDEESAKGVCMVFTEMAVAYLPLLMAREAYEQEQLVALVLQCAAHPSPEVGGYTLPFWYDLAMAFQSAEEKDPTLVALKRQQFGPALSQLVLVLVGLMRLPCADSGEDGAVAWEEMEGEEKAERVDYRYKLGDALNDACSMLGAPACLNAIATRLHQAAGRLQQEPSLWKECEACLWAVRSIAVHIPKEEDEAGGAMRHIMQMVLALPPAAALPPTLQETINHVVGNNARWLRGHAELLTPLYSRLLASLPSPTTAPSAARAIRDVCFACGALIGHEPALALYSDLLAASLQGRVAFPDEMLVLEGICAVVSALPPEQARAAEARMVAPVAEHLMALLNEARASAPTAGGETAAAASHSSTNGNDRSSNSSSSKAPAPLPPSLPKRVEQCLDRLTAMLRFCEPRASSSSSVRGAGAVNANGPSPCVESLTALLPVLEACYQAYKHKAAVMEKLCRLLKHALRTGKAQCAPLLDSLLAFLAGGYGETRCSSFVYAASIVVAEFGDARPPPRGMGAERAAQFLPRLLRLLEEMSRVTLHSLLTMPADFQEYPDVVEEYSYFVSRFLAVCPDALLQQHCHQAASSAAAAAAGAPRSALMDSVLQYAMAGLTGLQRREASRSLLHLLETFLDAGLPPTDGSGAPRPQAPGGAAAEAERRAWVLEAVLPQAEALLAKLAACLAGETPRDLVDDDRDASVCGVLWRLGRLLPPQLFQAGLHTALLPATGAVPEQLAAPQERQRACEGMCAAAGREGREERRRFFAAATALAWRCRENARRWRKMQQGGGGALAR